MSDLSFGKIIIDKTIQEAFLVRKKNDTGDIFIIDTTDSQVSIPTNTTIGTTVNPNSSTGGALNVGGDLVLGATTPRIYFPINGVGPPTLTNRSVGTKIVLWSEISSTNGDFSIGIDSGVLWNSVPHSSDSFKWYGGITEAMSLSGSGNLSLTGTVDGRDISADGGNLDNLYTTIGLSALTTGEVDQLENIGATTISATQWGYLGATDQPLATTDSVQFNSAIIDSTSTEALLVRRDADGGNIFSVDTTNQICKIDNNTGTGGGVLQFHDINHSIYGRYGYDGVHNVMDFYGYSSIRFYTGGLIASQTKKFEIGTSGIVAETKITIDTTSTEALLVRKDGDTGDVFTVDTTNSKVLVNGIVVEPTTGDITNTSFAGVNNQVAASNVTGLLFAEASIKSFIIIATIKVDATSDLYQQIEIRGLQKASGTWVIADIRLGDDTDVEFTMLSTGGNGQIQYTSANYTGFSSLDITFRAWVN
jgi:hypothetical protein